jgi:hypothetical protein
MSALARGDVMALSSTSFDTGELTMAMLNTEC